MLNCVLAPFFFFLNLSVFFFVSPPPSIRSRTWWREWVTHNTISRGNTFSIFYTVHYFTLILSQILLPFTYNNYIILFTSGTRVNIRHHWIINSFPHFWLEKNCLLTLHELSFGIWLPLIIRRLLEDFSIELTAFLLFVCLVTAHCSDFSTYASQCWRCCNTLSLRSAIAYSIV